MGDTAEKLHFTNIANTVRAVVAALAEHAGIRHGGAGLSNNFVIPYHNF